MMYFEYVYKCSDIPEGHIHEHTHAKQATHRGGMITREGSVFPSITNPLKKLRIGQTYHVIRTQVTKTLKKKDTAVQNKKKLSIL